MNIIGIDIAKSTFEICVMNKEGRVKRRLKTNREKLVETVTALGEGIIAMEACGGANYWGREFKARGYEVRVMAGQFVKPFVKSQKNDRADAEAICEAASRKQMRFVGVKTEEQQDIQCVHRERNGYMKRLIAIGNEVRGFLCEYGITIKKGLGQISKIIPRIMEEELKEKPILKRLFSRLYEEFCFLRERIKACDKELKEFAEKNEACERLIKIPGVGVITATAVVCSVGDYKIFENGRQFAAWIGLVPNQHSTGGKERLGGITKRGDKYLRRLLVQCASAFGVMVRRKRKKAEENRKKPILNKIDFWLLSLMNRKTANKARVALANKLARIIYSVLKGNEFIEPKRFALAA